MSFLALNLQETQLNLTKPITWESLQMYPFGVEKRLMYVHMGVEYDKQCPPLKLYDQPMGKGSSKLKKKQKTKPTNINARNDRS